MDPGLRCEKLVTNSLSQGTPTSLAAVLALEEQQQLLHHWLRAHHQLPS